MSNCSLLKHLTEFDIKRINSRLSRFKDAPEKYESFLRENFENFADQIINIVNNKKSKGEDIILLPIDLYEDIPTENDVKATQVLEATTFGEDDIVEINYNGDRNGINRMFKTFSHGMIESAIYNQKTKSMVHPNARVISFGTTALNRNIFKFKERLIQDISSFTGFDYTPGFTSPSEFEAAIQGALGSFYTKNTSPTLTDVERNTDRYQNALDAFTILKNFDKLLKQTTPFIAIKEGYENIQAKDRYEYKGADIKLFKTWATKEEVSIEDQISDVTGILLDYFPEYRESGSQIDGTSISKVGFYQVMTAFKHWANSLSFRHKLTDVKSDKDAYNKLYDLYNGNIDTIHQLFRVFCKDSSITGISKTKREGIKKMLLEANLDPEIIKMFWNLTFKTEKNIMKTTSIFDRGVSNKLLQDEFKTKQLYHIQDAISSTSDRFKYFEPEGLNKFKNSTYGLKINDDGDVITLFLGKPYETKINYKTNKGFYQIEIELTNPKLTSEQVKEYNLYTKRFIELFLDLRVPDNFLEIMEQASSEKNNKTLMDLYAGAIGVSLFAINDQFESIIENLGDPLREKIKWQSVNNNFDSLQTFLGIAYGTNLSSTLRNKHGNNVAAYTLTSLAYNLHKLHATLENENKFKADRDNAFAGNIVYNNINQFSNPTVRGDIDIFGKKKNARDLNDTEIQYVALICDFWNNYSKGLNLEFQNDVFSDKNTHFSFVCNLGLKLTPSITIKNIIEQILNRNTNQKGVSKIEDIIYNSRQVSYQNILNNLIADFKDAGFTEELQELGRFIDDYDISGAKIRTFELNPNWKLPTFNAKKIELLKKIFVKYKDTDIIKNRFESIGLDYVEELHNKINETLFHAFDMYLLDSTKKLFERRMNREKQTMLELISNSGFKINPSIDSANVESIVASIGREWQDTISGEIIWSKNVNGKTIMNPILEAYFYSDVLLSNNVSEIIFGKTFFHPNKYRVKEYDPNSLDNDVDEFGNYTENYYLHCEASRKSAANKRTVIAGATVHPFFHKKYGTQAKINMAVVKDLPATVFTMMGISKDDLDAMDGSMLVSPHQSNLENSSLLDAKVGYDKKTIFGSVGSEYGMPTLLKMAAFAITNDRRRLSMGSEISMEHLYKKMHDREVDLSNLNFKFYYGKSVFYDKQDSTIQLTETNPVFVDDYLTGKYYRIDNLRLELIKDKPVAKWSWIEVDRDGNEIQNVEPIPKELELKSIYDLDQVFGGAWCMQYNESTKRLEYSNANIDIVTKIICNEGLKDSFVSYITNKSAIKVGARNVNSYKTLYYHNDDELSTTTMDISFGGVQMDADHLLKDSDVTEMSQMISSLIQNGFFTEDVLSIYEEIGKIVTDSLKIDTDLMKSGDFTKIHQNLGKSLIESFSRGDKDTIGLAQSYLLKASKELQAGNENIKIPFSDPGLHGSFIANLVSNINKKGIKRKYAGTAAVLVPSRGMIQNYRINGVNYTFRDLCDYLRENGYNENPELYIRSTMYNQETNTYDNPFIEPVLNRRNIDFGDTILIGEGNDIQPIKVDNYDIYDEIRNTGKYNGQNIYKWTIRPQDLRQSDTTFDVNGEKYSIYDLNSVRAGHYLRKLTNNGKLDRIEINNTNIDTIRFIEKVIQKPISGVKSLDKNDLIFIERQIKNRIRKDMYDIDKKHTISRDSIPEFYSPRLYLYNNPNAEELFLFDEKSGKTTLEQLLAKDKTTINSIYEFSDVNLLDKLYIAYHQDMDAHQMLIDIIGLYNSVKDKYTLNQWIDIAVSHIGLDLSGITIDYINDIYNTVNNKSFVVNNVNTRFAEIMMGRVFAEQLGLRKGDSISKIKKQGKNFFIDRLKNESKLPVKEIMPDDSYDMMLCGRSGERLFVCIDNGDTSKLQGLLPSHNHENRDGVTYYNNKELCDTGSKRFYTKVTPNGIENIVFVNDLSEVDDLMSSELYTLGRYNYRTDNYEKLFRLQYRDYFDENGIVIKDLYYTSIGYTMDLNNNVIESDQKSVLKVGESIDKILNDSNAPTFLVWTENNEYNYRINTVAEHLYTAFEQSLICIGARIPTQSMQSFMGMEIVGFTESDVNEVYVPAIQTFLQGSDYDIDKLYIMMYDISKSGKLHTFSKLQGGTGSINQIFNLTAPTGIKFEKSIDSGTLIDNNEVLKAINLDDVSAFNKVINSENNLVRFTDNVPEYYQNRFMHMLNKHNSKKLKGKNKESALKNLVVHKIQNLLRKPLNQIPAHQPITMETFQRIAEISTLGQMEQRLTSDNPFAKFMMQVQNMVGKDVIGVTAVGMKVFFATTTFINMRVNDLVKLLEQTKVDGFHKTSEFDLQIQECLQDIFFIDHAIDGESTYATLANINLQPILEVLNGIDYTVECGTLNTIGRGIFDDKNIDLIPLITNAIEHSSTIDAAEGISQLLSCATDNAKELILAKINATVDFADAWSYLMTSGWTVEKIAELMMHPIFNIVSKYSKTNIFSPVASYSTPEKAINFVLGENHLSDVDLAGLKIVMGTKNNNKLAYDNNCFIHKLIYRTDDDGKIIVDSDGNPVKLSIPYITDDELAQAFVKGSDFRAQLLSIINSPISHGVYSPERTLEISEILQKHIKYLFKTKINDGSLNYFDEGYDLDNFDEMDYSYEDGFSDEYYEDDMDYENDDYIERRINNNDFDLDKTWNVDASRLRKLYCYLTNYVIPKNAEVCGLKGRESDYNKLKYFKDYVLPGVKEQQINGSNLGVNQGLKTNEYEFYSKLKRTEIFVRERTRQLFEIGGDPDNSLDLFRFNILRMFSDPEYRKLWENYYESVKTKTNVLKLINGVSNFSAMFKLNELAYGEMQHAVLSKLNWYFAEHLLHELPPQKLNQEEWNVMHKYNRDLLLRGWLYSRNIQFSLPIITHKDGKIGYFEQWNKGNYEWRTLEDLPLNSETIVLNNDDSSATFVRLFENYIVPLLKEKYNNAFTKNISTSNKFSRTYNQKIRHKRLSMNMMMIDSSVKTKAEYAEMLKSFNEIADDIIDGIGLSVKDALFIYNTIVYKNSFSEDGFTRLLETINLKDTTSLVNDYAEFLATLDAGEINLGSMEIDEDGSFSFGPIEQGNINDLLYRLSFTKNASSKFGVSHTKNEDGAIDGLIYVDMFGEQKENTSTISIKNPDANDYCWEMPVAAELNAEKQHNKPLGQGLRKLFGYNSREVIFAVTDSLIDKFGLQDRVIRITNEDIRKSITGESSDFEFSFRELNRIKNAKAFVHNGNIYINTDRITGDTLIHELMHIICASAKFNSDESIRTKYYKMLQEAIRYVNSNPTLKAKMNRLYQGDYASDFKEECLIHILSENFATTFKSRFGKMQFTDDISSYVKTILNELLETSIPNDNIDDTSLGNTGIGDLMMLFSSKLLDKENNQISSANVILSQQLKTLKRILIEAGYNGKNSYIKYNC